MKNKLLLIMCMLLCLTLILERNVLSMSSQVKKNPQVKMEIEINNSKNPFKGEIVIELLQNKAPISVGNFLSYVDDEFYDGTIFHRVIDNFMIQGGGFDPGLKQKEALAPIKNEATNRISNQIGTIAMARTGIVDSATSQFFINVNNNNFLDHQNESTQGYGYAVFGKVVKGMDIINKIKTVETTTKSGYADVPVYDVTIKTVRQLN